MDLVLEIIEISWLEMGVVLAASNCVASMVEL